MSTLNDSALIFKYHRDMLRFHGKQSSRALGWRDWESQQVRFGILAEMDDLNGLTVLDAGCGHADLLPYLFTRYPALKHYCGVEQIPELLEEAVARFGHLTKTTFISGNFISRPLPPTDYLFVSGSLNYSSADPAFIYKAITKLYNNCYMGFGFNLLSCVPANGCLVAYKPDNILCFCKTLSAKVVLRDGYAEEDFTVFMYH